MSRMCQFCGSYNMRGCAWYFNNDIDPDMGGAPCEEMDDEDVFGPLDDEDEDACPQCHGPVHESGFCPSCKECVK